MIEIKDLNYIASNRKILENINLTLANNEFAALIGPNGAGKSTLIKIILGILNQSSGTITIDGMDNKKWLKHNIIAYLPQYEKFDRDFPATSMDITLMGLVGEKGIIGRINKSDYKRAYKALEQVNMYEKRDQLIGSLSGGEMQRVYIARALTAKSDYLFLDEPEAGVDKGQIEDFYNLLLKLNKSGKTILLISHDIGMMTEYSRYIICLNKTLHCHTQSELVNADILKKTYGDVMKLIEKRY